MDVGVDRFPRGHVAIEEDLFDRAGALLHIAVGNERKRPGLFRAVTAGAVLVHERGDVLIESDFGREGRSQGEQEEGCEVLGHEVEFQKN